MWFRRLLELFRRRRRPQRVIAAAPKGIAAFAGAASAGPSNEPVMLHAASEARKRFGSGPLVEAAELFFANGGREAHLIRDGSLETVDGCDVVVLPGVSDPALVAEAAASCERRRAFLLVDAPAGAGLDEALEWAKALPRSANAAAYFPGPAAAAVAGVLARLDVWRAPAGGEAALSGGEPSMSLDERGAERLAQAGVNALRTLPGGRTAPWSARTLSSDPEWKYVNIRRLFLYLERSIDQGTQWVVFEPNAEPTWAGVRTSVDAFLLRLWRAGALLGDRPEQAYFVRCDRTTMTQADIDSGRLIIEVGFAPLKPAEFVILRIQHLLGATA